MENSTPTSGRPASSGAHLAPPLDNVLLRREAYAPLTSHAADRQPVLARLSGAGSHRAQLARHTILPRSHGNDRSSFVPVVPGGPARVPTFTVRQPPGRRREVDGPVSTHYGHSVVSSAPSASLGLDVQSQAGDLCRTRLYSSSTCSTTSSKEARHSRANEKRSRQPRMNWCGHLANWASRLSGSSGVCTRSPRRADRGSREADPGHDIRHSGVSMAS